MIQELPCSELSIIATGPPPDRGKKNENPHPAKSTLDGAFSVVLEFSLSVEDEDGGGDDGRPQAALVADGRLRDVGGTDDLV
jgi:hypothetical protein